MKIFKIMMMALVAMCGLNSCSDDCNHDFIEHDYSKELVGTWTCMDEDYAEALVINADGSLTATGVVDGEFFESKGTIQVKNNKMIYKLDNGDEWEGRFEMIAGQSFSMVFDEELDIQYTYHYCANDLADEVVGMWVLNEGVAGMTIQSYQNDGKSIFTGFSLGANDYMTNMESTYNVVGDLLFQKTGDMHFVTRLTYVPNGTSLGDILHTTATIWVNNAYVTSSYSFLRVKQNLNLTGKTYDYSTAYVTNAKGADEDFTIAGETFNIANITGYDFDEMFGSDLFSVEFPNANTIKHKFRPNGQNVEDLTPITVDGNKVTLDMGASNPAWRTVEMYMFQDADNSQLHIFMSTQSCINYLANLEIPALIEEGKLDPTDSAAIAKVFADMEARIESINVTFVMKVRK